MAALTPDQVIRIRRFVGDDPPDADLEAPWARHSTLKGVVLEILEIRRANLLASPVQFTITGEYAQNARWNVAFIEQLITKIRAGSLDPDTDDLSENLSVVRVVQAVPIRR